MKNRLELAKDLLKETGIIFVHLDYNESHYCKVLLDEIFGRENFINEVVWKRKSGTANESRRFATTFDSILLYGKNKNYDFFPIREKNSKKVQTYIEERFIKEDKEGPNKGRRWAPYPLANPGKPSPGLIYDYKGYKAPKKGWRISKATMEKWESEGRLYFPEDKNQRISEKKFLDEYEGQPVNNLWTDIYVINPMAKEALDFDGQKPEKLLKRIILLGTKEKEIVLDFFVGSGTTCAVAHKMNRQYIGIEQINYGERDAVTRLKKVIKGDKTGISEEVGWKGGGEFVYCELMKLNQKYIEEAGRADSKKEVEKVWERVKDGGFISHKLNVEEFDKARLDFEKLSLEEQKRFLVEILDKNQLYVNLSEINDGTYKISEGIKKLNNQFYKGYL